MVRITIRLNPSIRYKYIVAVHRWIKGMFCAVGERVKKSEIQMIKGKSQSIIQ